MGIKIVSAAALLLICFGVSTLLIKQPQVSRHAAVISSNTVLISNDARPVDQDDSPIRLTSHQIGIDTSIKQGGYISQSQGWVLDSENAFTAKDSATTMIYGHNTLAIFGNLHKAGAGIRFELEYTDRTVSYEYAATRIVDAGEVSVLSEKNDGYIMLMVCTGLFDEQRHIIYIRRIS